VLTGVDVVHVPYRGGAQIMTDLMSGQIQAAVDSLPSSLPHIRSGKIRALALLSAERSSVLPDVPIASEIVPGFEVRTFSGVGVPTGTPPAIIERLNKEINAGLKDEKIRARFAEVGGMPVIVSSAEANAFVRAQTEKWAKLIKEAGIKAE
jgi:tripartite-type tricarboxylate transporter receptor subunit TctC